MILNAFDGRMDHRSIVEAIPPIQFFCFFWFGSVWHFEVICLVIGHLGGAAGGPRPRSTGRGGLQTAGGRTGEEVG